MNITSNNNFTHEKKELITHTLAERFCHPIETTQFADIELPVHKLKRASEKST